MKKALVLAFALVLGLGAFAFAGPLSGSWTSKITMDPQTAPMVTDFSSTVVVNYTVGTWAFKSTTGFELGGWKTQKFTADGTLGAFTLGSSLVFDPTHTSFTDWDSTGSISIAGVDLSGEFLLTGTGYDPHNTGTPDPAGAGWKFGVKGPVGGDIELGATAYFNSEKDAYDTLHVQSAGSCFCFSSVEFTADFSFACISEVSATIDFSKDGFDSATFEVDNITVPNISWLTFDATLEFTIDSKSPTLTPKFDLGNFGCITLYYELVQTGSYTITGLDIYGLSLTKTWGEVTFTDKTSFDPAKNKKITGNADYFELFQIKSTGDSCCGGGVDFSVSTYFKNGSGKLFDWGETDAFVEFGIGSNFTINGGLNVNSTGLTKITAGFEVEW